MALQIFNSSSRKKEHFVASNARVGMYVCGITPYDVTHLGHAFTYTAFDVVARYLRYKGYQVCYAQNLTDIDDDILRKAKEIGKDWRALGEENAAKFLEEMRWLHNNPPDWYVRATDYIADMVEIIKRLEKRGLAYAREGSVYFALAKYRAYGKLSKLSRDEMLPIANQRGNNPDDPHKNDPLDFVLWQRQKPGEPFWVSPWGNGRPGWHIECSAMAMKRLGATIDIHGGGLDLLFPHHESSLAQSEGATGKPFARYWMHTGMMRYKGEKMSKSLGNLVLIGDLQKGYRANDIRIYLLSHHYRSAFEFLEKDLKKVCETRKLFMRVWRVQSGQGNALKCTSFQKRFYQAMDDDLDTPKALAFLEELMRAILNESREGANIREAKAFLNEACQILGLMMEFR